MYHRHGVGTTIALGVVVRLRLIARTVLRRVCTTFHLRGFGRVLGGPYVTARTRVARSVAKLHLGYFWDITHSTV